MNSIFKQFNITSIFIFYIKFLRKNVYTTAIHPASVGVTIPSLFPTSI